MCHIKDLSYLLAMLWVGAFLGWKAVVRKVVGGEG